MEYIINDNDLGPIKGTLSSGTQWDFDHSNDMEEIRVIYNLVSQKLVLHRKSKIDFHCFEGENNEPFYAVYMLDVEPHELIGLGTIYNEKNVKPTKEEIVQILEQRFPNKKISIAINPGL